MKILIYLVFLIIVLKFIESKNINKSGKVNGNGELILNVQDVQFAQTHVIPAEGKRWSIKNKEYILKLIPNRAALLMAKFNANYSINSDGSDNNIYLVRVWSEGREITIKMKSPNDFPPTEDNGPKYSTVHHSCIIPGEWIKNGIQIQFENKLNSKSKVIKPNVGQERELILWILPIYLFGANDKNTVPFSNVKQIDSSIISELIQKWSVTNIESINHPIGRINWPYLIIPPRNGYPAIKVLNSSQKKDTFAIMDTILLLLKGIRNSMGEFSSSNLIYSPLLQLDSNGKYEDPYGGLGCVGGGVGVGDHLYSGVFIHEIGHSFGLHHSGNQYNKGEYPYIKGSLKGSSWGYDSNKNEFISIYIPKSSNSFRHCQKYYEISDDGKYCIKQSIMQDGDGNQAKGYRYSILSDYEMVIVQNYFEKSIYYNGSRYLKFNSTSNQYYNYKPKTKEYGLYGIVNEGLPIERDIDVYTIAFTYSTVGPSELSQFYPIIKSKGNLIKYFDPTNHTDIKNIIPNQLSSSTPWYCQESGCDFSIKIIFNNNSTQHILIPKGKRKWWAPTKNQFMDGLYNSKSIDSFIFYVLNVKSIKNITIKQIQLIETPFGFNGISNSNSYKILISKSF